MLHRVRMAAFLKALRKAEASYLTHAVAAALSSGRVMSTDELIEFVYGNSYEPEYAVTNIKIAVWRLRKYGFNVVTECARGYYHPKVA